MGEIDKIENNTEIEDEKIIEKTITVSEENWEKFNTLKKFYKEKNNDKTMTTLLDFFCIHSNKNFYRINNQTILR